MPEEKPIGIVARQRDPLSDVGSGQPLWYWALPRERKVEILRGRAKAAGCAYLEDISATGCLSDGSPPPKARRETKAPGFKMTAARRAAIEARAKELLERRKT